MSDLGVGFIDILPRSDKFTTLLTGQMKKALTGITGQWTQDFGKAFAAAQVGVVALGAAAVVGITKGIQATTEWAAEVRSLQRVTGLAAEDASRLAGAGNLLGISTQKLATGFGLLSKNIVNGSTNFEKYGVATTDATGATLPFLDILANVSDKFATLPAGPEQAAFAMNIFGQSGKDLIPILQRGSAGLQDLYDKAEAAGLVMGQDTLDASKNLSIAQRELGDAVKGASIAIGESFLPVAQKVTEALTSLVELVVKIPAPIRTVGLSIVALAGGAIVLQKALVLMGTASKGAVSALGRISPVAILATAGLLELSALVDSFGTNLAKVGQETGFTTEQLDALNTKFAEGGILKSTSSSWSEFATKIDGVKDNVKGLAEALSPFIGKLTELGLSSQQATDYLFVLADGMQNVTQGAIDELTVKIQENVDAIDKAGVQYGKGKISLEDYTAQVEAMGFTHEQALSLAGASLDQYGKHLDAAGTKVNNFANMTSKAIEEWAGGIRETIGSTFSTIGTTIANTFDMTPKEAQRAFAALLRAAIRWKQDLAAVLALKPGTFGLSKVDMQRFEVWLTHQAPGFVDGFVHGTQKQQQTIIDGWAKMIQKNNAASKLLDPLEPKVNTAPATREYTMWINGLPKTVTIDVQTGGVAGIKYGPFAPGPVAQGPWTGGFITRRGVRHFALGGPAGDTVPAMLTPGEFVMRRSAVKRIGENNLQRMNDGGYVGGASSVGGEMRISDWRTGLASLDVELAWEDAVRNR